MNAGALYAGREQTLVKHFILESYLERFAYIVGSAWDVLTYVDCFSGPWNVRSDKLQDSSFYIALNRLRKAATDLAARGRNVSLRCFFLEKNESAYQQLKQFAARVDYAEVATKNAALEDSVDDICDFVTRGGTSAFPFIFVDPTGWTGFRMDVIGPLLRLTPGEVLVNFMTGHILRFAECTDPSVQRSFEGLFGAVDYRQRIAGLAGQDREDELVQCYADALRLTGGFDYVCTALVLHPEKDRTHFHLIYATRNAKGVEVFKQVEKKAVEVMEKARADAQQRHREEKSRQPELFDSEAMHDRSHCEALRERYLSAARAHLTQMLQHEKRVLFDAAWVESLRFPLVWDSDVKAWIKDQQDRKLLRLEGLSPGERVPKRDAGHYLVWEHGPSHE